MGFFFKSFFPFISIFCHIFIFLNFFCIFFLTFFFYLSGALYGMKDLGSVGGMVKALTVKVRGCTENFKAHELGFSLYGLQNMTSDDVDVCGLIDALVPKVIACREPLDANAVGTAIYGLRGLSNDNPSVMTLINALLPKVEGCGRLSDLQEGFALVALSKMSDTPEVLALRAAVTGGKVVKMDEKNAEYIKQNAADLIAMKRQLAAFEKMITNPADLSAFLESTKAKTDKADQILAKYVAELGVLEEDTPASSAAFEERLRAHRAECVRRCEALEAANAK